MINEITKGLKIETHLMLASEMIVHGSKGDLLLDICKNLCASTYVSPAGSAVYLDGYAGFSDSGITLEYQTFEHPSYMQSEMKFVPHLSVIDAICNIEVKATKEMIKKGSRVK